MEAGYPSTVTNIMTDRGLLHITYLGEIVVGEASRVPGATCTVTAGARCMVYIVSSRRAAIASTQAAGSPATSTAIAWAGGSSAAS